MLTIFASPKAFTREFDVIQRNAVASWTRLRPRPQVLLIGNEPGTAAACRELGAEHLPDVRVNEFGTPYADSILELAEQHAVHPFLLWIAADTMLCDGVTEAVNVVSRHFDRFCMIAGRYRLARAAPINFEDPDWQLKLKAGSVGPLLEDVSAGDFFVFPRGFWGRFPPFIEGRSALDGWMLFRALETRAALVDATLAVTTIHQDHTYAQHPAGAAPLWSGPEAKYNLALAGRHMLTRENADWMLTPEGLRRPPQSFRRHVAWCARFAAFHPRVGWPLRVYRYLMERAFLGPAAARVDAIARAAVPEDLSRHASRQC
jgi:hypothetical protein